MELSIAQKIAELKVKIKEAAAHSGRPPEAVRLILVTKTVPVEKIREAYSAGIRDFGENRMQDLLDKKDQLPKDVRWHFVGHLQTNKVKYLLSDVMQGPSNFELLHSLDRQELAHELETQAAKRGVRKIPCLIQVNSSNEITKGGFEPSEVSAFVESLKKDSVLSIAGLMTIGPLTEDREKARQAFRLLKQMGDDLKRHFPDRPWEILSMGMSDDYEIAIEEGANLLRIGSAVFGARSIP